MPPYLKAELEALGLPSPVALDAGVRTEGTLADCMNLNLWVRSGHRVLFELKRLSARSPDDLYDQVGEIPWEEIIAEDGYFRVEAHIRDTEVNDSRFAALRVKDAIADRFMKQSGQRPNSGPETKGICLFLRWHGDQAFLYLDTSGEPLPRRGYRKRPHTAPMQESLAAACVLASTWPSVAAKGGHFIAPMCGSGTLAIEAALIAMNGAPGLLRDSFAFMHVLGYDPQDWEALCAEAEKAENPGIPGRIIATDNDPRAIEAARGNADDAGVGDFIEFEWCDFRSTIVPEGHGVVMLNPEYGLRLGDTQQLEDDYKGIGDFFKQRCGGYMGYVFTGNLDLAKNIGLRTKRKILFFNAKIECRLLEYELYAGSRKS
jgi:putative N6-adenine-specific DNA methylase